MAKAYHVFGAADIQVGTGGAGALESLGFTEDGGDITITMHERPIMSDPGGTELPAETQHMGEDAIIRLRMPVVDQAILDKVLIKIAGDATSPAPGEQATAGRLHGTSGDAVRLALVPPSGSSEAPWNFPFTKLRSHRRKEGTPATYVELEFYAWVFLLGTDVSRKDKVLYTRVVP